MAGMPHRLGSIFKPIILASVGVALSIALLVGWTAVLLKNNELTEQVAGNISLMVSGILSLVIIISVLIWFGVYLVREILEGRRQASFIDSVTHELKSPLASLKLCLETLAREGISPGQKEQLRSMMMADLERLSAFIDDVLAANRIASQRHPLDQGEVDLCQLVDECVVQVTRRHKLEASVVRVDIDRHLRLMTDPLVLRTVMTNLIDNAVKYSAETVDILVKARQGQASMAIEVRDHGIGIPPQYLSRIFERFYRAPGEAVQARRGTGLGLYVAAMMIRRLQGKLVANSEGPDQGTTMRISLPLAGATS